MTPATRWGWPARMLGAACVAVLSGCATPDRPAPARTEPAAPVTSAPKQAQNTARFNLAGFSESYRAGHADACASPQRRNQARFDREADYSMGWNDGRYACDRRH
jgi:hypothetical protein